MMPIRKGDGTGLSVPGFSEVRTGDGTVLWSAGADIPDSAVDSFEDESLSEYTSSSDFTTTTNRAFDGSVSVQSTSDAHQNFWWSEQTIAAGETATVSIWLWTGGPNRAGPTLVDGSGNGYMAYADNDGGFLYIRDVVEDGTNNDLGEVSVTYPSSEWVKAELSFDGVDAYTATVYDNTETALDSVSVTDSTYTPDRHGFHQFDSGIEADLLEKSL